jgi:hypothetical protein
MRLGLSFDAHPPKNGLCDTDPRTEQADNPKHQPHPLFGAAVHLCERMKALSATALLYLSLEFCISVLLR